MTEAGGRIVWSRGGLRRTWFALLTALGVAERGFFIPYRYAGKQRRAACQAAYPALEAVFEGRREQFRQVLLWLDGYAAEFGAIGALPPPAPRWDQDWFPRLDAAAAYALVRRLAPARIVEVGSGHSTRFLLQAIADGGLATRVTSIDPAPRASLAAQDARLSILRRTVQEAGTAPFEGLAAGDLLSIDSSHILMPGSDVDFLLGRVLPRLPVGAYLHLHDIFLPDDYPAAWRWRAYNEQLGVLPLLLGGVWEPIFASHYVVSRMAAELSGSCVAGLPLGQGARESSLWLRRRSDPPGAASRGNE